MADAGNRNEYASIWEAAQRHGSEFPLIAIDGEVRVAGGINFTMIYDAIERRDETADVPEADAK